MILHSAILLFAASTGSLTLCPYEVTVQDPSTVAYLTELAGLAEKILDLTNTPQSDSSAFRKDVSKKLAMLLEAQHRMEQRLASIESRLVALGIQLSALHEKQERRELSAVCSVVEERYGGWLSQLQTPDVRQEIRNLHDRLSVARARYIMFDADTARLGAAEFLTVAYALAIERALWDLLDIPAQTRKAVVSKYASYFRECADWKVSGSVSNVLASLRKRYVDVITNGSIPINHREAIIRILWHEREQIELNRRTIYRYHRNESQYGIYVTGNYYTKFTVRQEELLRRPASTSDGNAAYRDNKVAEAVNAAERKYDRIVSEFKYCEEYLPVAEKAHDYLKRLETSCSAP